MSNYILPILIFSLTLGCWALFQLWTGRQADGSSIDGSSDIKSDSACGGCETPRCSNQQLPNHSSQQK